MRLKYEEKSIEFKVLKRLKTIRSVVVLRRDFNELGSYSQISRVINKLISDKKLVRIGSGIYAKAYISKYTQYTDIPLIKNGTHSALREALRRLNIKFERGSAEQEYNEGKTTQIPVHNIVKLKERCRRRIGYRNSQLRFEGNINAK